MVFTIKRTTKLLTMVIATFILTSCARSYFVHKENPTKITKAGQYESLYISWLDLHENDWDKHGYESQAAWKNVIHDENMNGLRPRMKQLFPKMTLYFANADDTQFPNQGDLYIKFNVERIVKKWNALTGGFDELHLNVSFIDIKTQQELYSAKINTTSMPEQFRDAMGFQLYSFEGRLGVAIYNVCSFVHDKLTQ